MSEEEWDLVYDLHMKGAFKVSRAAYSHMREQGYGRFVMTASAAGIYGNFGQANYSACKLALHGLSQTIAIEGKKRGVQSNTIAPLAASRMMSTVMDEKMMEKIKPEAVSPLVAQLCHESCETTGALFEVGGGWVARLRWERSLGAHFSSAEFGIDDVAAEWTQIGDFSNATNPSSVADSMKAISTNWK
jgi:3-hydroxyacyl-CoA dehydrogenase/3a,7a,12a-trihydroxy-5b-cholest-24-enoyl-CoA hydratase